MLSPLILVLLAAAPETPAQAVELAARVKPSVVLLEVIDPSGTVSSSGTGFLVSERGATVTNAHVIRGAVQMRATLADGSKRKALGVLAVNEDRDVALIALEGGGYRALELGDSSQLAEGTQVMVVGSPLGLSSTVSQGIVSAARRELPEDLRNPEEMNLGALIQISAPISPGSSGSPVVTMDGRVIGVAQGHMVIGQNINFAVPIEVARELVAALPGNATPRPFRPFPLGNAIASGIFLFLLASTLTGLKVRGWLRAKRRLRPGEQFDL